MLKSGFGLLAGVLWLVGCSSTTSNANSSGAGSGGTDAGSGSSGAGGATTKLPEVDASTAIGFCRGYYAVVADLLARCYEIPIASAQDLLTDERLCDSFATSVSEGRIAFDASPAATCLTELGDAVSCDGPTDPAAVSHCAVLQPLVPTGGTCTLFSIIAVGRECLGDNFCQEADSYSCTGVCAERAPAGAPCGSSDVRCASGTTCDTVSKTCVTRLADVGLDGECGGVGLGDCEDDLWCERATSGSASGVCHARQTSGPCTSSTACATPTLCIGAEGAKACVKPKNEGESCTPGLRECNLFAHCGENLKCASAGVAIGQSCGNLDGESVSCVRDAYCERSASGAGTCQAKKQPGEACTGSGADECDGNRGHCDTASQLCVACP